MLHNVLTSSHYHVASAIFAEFAVIWIAALFTTQQRVLLLRSIIFATVLLYLAIKSDQLSHKYDH